MPDILLHEVTAQSIDRVIKQPAHAILLVGATGSGKQALAQHIAAGILGIDARKLAHYPYHTEISSPEGKAISIEAVRGLQKLMSLKIPRQGRVVARLAIITDAHLLTTEAQNALLKTLEEPPADTVLILTASSPEALLPTILSRVRTLHVLPPAVDDLKTHFAASGHDRAHIDRAVLLSGGLPGLTHALLTDPEGHPLYEATVQARQLLQATPYQRLTLVDTLSKQKQLAIDTLFILAQMSRMALMKTTDQKAAERWQNILKQSYQATERLRRNTQAKLVLTDLLLNL